jgi:hypothetical protein
VVGFDGSRGFTGSIGAQGAQGTIGFTGSVGAQGAQGTIGFTGSIGAQGAQGTTGPQGVIGFTGSLGAQGPQGTIGFTGSLGAQGPQGTIGFTGSIGAQGAQGTIGFTGSIGAQGPQGTIGFTGSRGVDGFAGSRGFTGSIGAQGTNGFTGSTGIQGAQGTIGFTGSQGAQGPQGTIGFTGSLGPQGPQGTVGFTGSIGAQGPQGNLGPQGPQGGIGFTGSIGAQGAQGAIGPQGVIGFTGSVGAQGAQGTIGFTGSRGIDGFAGSRGFTGSIGAQGAQGTIGFTGSIGAQGAQGPQGVIGFTGSLGAQGAQGTAGFIGSIGAQGAQGTIGFTGSIGAQGAQGPQGTTGFVGSRGPGDYNTMFANFTLTGGGTVTWNGSSILWSARVIAIPVENTEFGSSGYIDMNCPTSGTVTHYSATGTTTKTCTAAGIPLAIWESIYYQVTPGQGSGSDQTKFRVVQYQNADWDPGEGWILICSRNGDDNSVKWMPGNITLPGASGTYTSSTATASWRTGFTGSIGAQGAQGAQGTIGFTGSIGAQGPQGNLGPQGPQGGIGFTGSIGAQGAQGTIGFTGSIGAQGPQGTIGFTGSRGVVGFDGSRGFTGSIGAQGAQGVIGFTGSVGAQGPQGNLGPQGPQGGIGFTGSVGAQGPQGNLGPQGPIGYTGSWGGSALSNVDMNSYNITETGGISTSTGGGLRIIHPGGASYATGSSSITGAIKIELPAYRTSTMMRMTVKLYEYADNESMTWEIGGYNYGPGSWYSLFAQQICSDGQPIRTIRFGYENSKNCIWIGETSTTWSYPQVFVTEFQAGYSSYAEDTWNDGWTISFVTTLGTVENSITPSLPKGFTGSVGATGPQGNLGPQGPQGLQGAQGPAGPPGPQGPQGAQGAQGATGPTGPTGNPFGGGNFTGAVTVNGVTINNPSHYQWEGATYRNPGDHTPPLIIRLDNSTGGINGSRPALSLYNQNGSDQTTVAMAFVSREQSGAGNDVNLGGIIAKKQIAGTSGNWTQGSLTLYTRSGGTRNDGLFIDQNGFVTIHGNESQNAYNATSGRRLMFGGADSDAQGNYYIGTNLEDYGGNYNKLDLRWHTGIRMGAQAGYGGIRFYDSEDLGTQVFAINKDGTYAQANQSMRAPIFYDLDNTGFYIDPNSTSQISYIRTGNVINIGGVLGDASIAGTNFHGIELHTEGNRDYYIGKPAGAWTQPLHVHFYTGIWYRAHSSYNGHRFYNINDNGLKFSVADGDNHVRVYSNLYAPIYYDIDNTGYYIDPNGTSYWATSQQNGWHYFNQNYGHGVVGLYASTRFQCVYAMGDAYKGNADGTSLTGAYGLWWSYPSAGGPAASLSSHGLMCIVNGSLYAQLDASTRAVTDMRAPIFYDLNDGAFYIDPASTSNINGLSGNGKEIFVTTDSYLRINQSSTFSNGCWFGATLVRADGFYAGSNGGTTTSRVHIGSGTYNGSRVIFLDGSNGEISAAGNITAYSSDRRLKTNIAPINSALDKVMSIGGYTFDWVEDIEDKGFIPDHKLNDAGVLAQEIQAVLPQAVAPAPFDWQWDEELQQNASKSGENYLTVRYERIVPLLIEAIKEQQARINKLEERINRG